MTDIVDELGRTRTVKRSEVPRQYRAQEIPFEDEYVLPHEPQRSHTYHRLAMGLFEVLGCTTIRSTGPIRIG